MKRIHERIPKEGFQAAFRPMVRSLGSKNVIIRLNENAKTAIPRQTKLKDLMPKLELLCYQQNRPKVDEELERLWGIYLDDRLGEREEQFYDLSDELNKNLEGEDLEIDASELQAVCFQHEIDHLDGILFIDRISRLKRNLYTQRRKKQLRRELEEQSGN